MALMSGQTQATVQVKYRSPASSGNGVHRNRAAHSLQAFGEHLSGSRGRGGAAQPPHHQYALPLRSITCQYHDAQGPAPEDRLRRKTPAGTLDAAYDGASSAQNANSHAVKHLIMPASSMLSDGNGAARYAPSSLIRNFTVPPLDHHPAHQQGSVYPFPRETCYKCPPNPNPLYFEPSQPLQPTSYTQYDLGPDAVLNSQEISPYPWHDQRIPNVAQPPLQTPLAQQHLPALSTTSFGLYGLHNNGWSRLVDPYQPEASLAQINQNILGLSLTDAVAHHNLHTRPTSTITLKDGSKLNGASSNGWMCSKAPSFAERVSTHSSRNPYFGHQTNTGQDPYAMQPTAERWVGQGQETSRDSHQYVSFASPTALQAQSQELLSRAHTVYVSLVSAIQEARKASLQGDPQSSRQYTPNISIYPEPVRKSVVTRNHMPTFGFDQEHYGWPSRRHGIDPHISSIPTHIGHPGVLDYAQHISESGSSGPNSINSNLPPADCQMQPSIGRDAPAPNYVNMHNSYDQISTEQLNWPSKLRPSDNVSHLMGNAWNALGQLTIICQEKSSPWLEGMLLAGCLAYVLGNYKGAAQWFRLILKHDARHVEATSNLAATLLACNRRQEAEQYWRLAIRLQPSYFDGAEHLIGLLCGDQRHKDAVAVVEYIQKALRIHPNIDASSRTDVRVSSDSQLWANAGKSRGVQDVQLSNMFPNTSGQQSTDPSQSNYDLVGDTDQCRIMALIHAKGNILYSQHDHKGAAKAFQEVVMIATGFATGCLKDLIGFIHSRLRGGTPQESSPHREPLLLNPEKALLTAKLCFGPTGDLPGLRGVSSKPIRKAAVSVASNSLLSLAKIYQDGMSSGTDQHSKLDESYGNEDILVLYYLSLSLQPSPSTANNVGILLASVQRTNFTADRSRSKEQDWFMFPNVVPGSGTALALTYYQYGLNLDSKHAHLFTNLGSLLKDIGQLSMAIKMYEKAVACDGNFDIALANLANAVKDQGKTADAIIYYKRAVKVNPNFAEAVCGLANALNSVCSWVGRGGIILKDSALDRWHVDQNGSLLDSRTTGGKGSGWVQRVIDIVDSQLTSGESWGRGILHSTYLNSILERLEASKPGPQKLSKQASHSLRLLLRSWHDQKWEGARVIRFLERVIKLLGWTWYQDKYVKRKEAPLSTYHRLPLPASLSNPSAPTVLPFHTFTFPMSAEQIRLISQRNGLRVSCSSLRAPWLPQTVYPPPPPPKPHLNVGYVSSDFNNHPLAHLMQSVFGMHDKRRVSAFCYATTASDKSSHRKQIEEEAHMFYDASSWPTERLVEQIVTDEIHILVNLNGYTRGARNEVFAARPAPIQMSFMGFAGTLGAEWCDYLLADEIAVPTQTLRPWRNNVDLRDLAYDEDSGNRDRHWVYGENIIYTRDTFFCCDHRQANASPEFKTMTWDQELSRRWAMRKELFPTLADDAVIFANFNQLYKIDPTTFRTWLRILSRTPHAVLWLLRFPDVGEQHLRATAVAWAGPAVAARLLFTDVAPKAVHIARACVADLFLDTPECNAHTTAADCLWSGTPLLTLPRYEWKMCSRMAASIVGGALPRHTDEGKRAWEELVASGEDEYEDTAVRLGKGLRYEHAAHGLGSKEKGRGKGAKDARGQGTGRLMDLRKMIWSHRWESKLFDTARWVRDLETAYEEAWRRWVAGEGGDIWMKELL